MPHLTIRDLVIRTASGRTILALPSLQLATGQTLGIAGPSGAGKSTLLYAVAGILLPTAGTITWDGEEITSLSESARDRFRQCTIGMIFQDFMLFDELSALENASIASAYCEAGKRDRVRTRAAELLEHLGIPLAGRDVSSFSGGERQRVAVARAMATDPSVILADEPTASLDRNNTDQLIADLMRLAREHGRTVITVSHDHAVLNAMDQTLQLVDGQLSSG